jgi:hypothetical protein
MTLFLPESTLLGCPMLNYLLFTVRSFGDLWIVFLWGNANPRNEVAMPWTGEVSKITKSKGLTLAGRCSRFILRDVDFDKDPGPHLDSLAFAWPGVVCG